MAQPANRPALCGPGRWGSDVTREWGGPDREQGEIVSRMGSFTPMNLPGEYDDLTADNIAGLTLAACFVLAERWDTFTAWCR